MNEVELFLKMDIISILQLTSKKAGTNIFKFVSEAIYLTSVELIQLK